MPPLRAASAVPGPPAAPSAQATFAATLVDEWTAQGVVDAVVCPGSRSTPLAMALAARSDLNIHVRLDERSAGFFALGLSLGSGRPTVICTTSGTAAAELHAAVIEADHAGVPLLVCTADRPPELQDVGAPQTVDQVHLFGRSVRWFCAPGVAFAEGRSGWRPLAARAYAEALASPSGPGPVHLNLAFREPLVGAPGPLPARTTPAGPLAEWRSGGWQAVGDGPERLWPGRRGAVVAGQGCGPPAAVLALARRLRWPVLADPRSGCRLLDPTVVAGADALLREVEVRRSLLPEVLLVLGAPWASKSVTGWVAEAAAAGADVVALDPWWRWRDPDHVVGRVVRADPGAWLEGLVASLGPSPAQPDQGDTGPGRSWLETWRRLEEAAQRALDQVLGREPAAPEHLSEPALARLLLSLVPERSQVIASSSMPVRDLESFVPPLVDPPRVLANRGANGIDGVCSTALGLAGSDRGPVVCVVGDLAFLHDVSALVRSAGSPRPSSCTIVVVDNGGGGIFSFLPQAAAVDTESFEQLFGTPQRTEVLSVARGFGVTAEEVRSARELTEALGRLVGRVGIAVVRVVAPSRSENVKLHRQAFDAVGQAARQTLSGH